MRIVLTIILCASLLLAACTAHGHSDSDVSPLKGDQVILAETARLATLANSKGITVQDFATLISLTEADHHAQDEVKEIQTMVQYGEYVHAGHGLGFLSTFIETGEHPICPGHSLAHYYVFAKHGERALAEEAFTAAKEQMPAWEAGMQTQLASFPGPIDFETMRAGLRANILAIEKKQPVPSDIIIEQLALLPCVEA